MVITIKRDAHAEIAVPKDAVEASDEMNLRVAAWLLSGLARRLGLKVITLVYEADESDEQR